MLSLSLFYILSEKEWGNFSKNTKQNNSTTGIFVLVTYGTFISPKKKKKNHHHTKSMLWHVGYFCLFVFVRDFLGAERKDTEETGLLQINSLVIPTDRHISYWVSDIVLNPKRYLMRLADAVLSNSPVDC